MVEKSFFLFLLSHDWYHFKAKNGRERHTFFTLQCYELYKRQVKLQVREHMICLSYWQSYSIFRLQNTSVITCAIQKQLDKYSQIVVVQLMGMNILKYVYRSCSYTQNKYGIINVPLELNYYNLVKQTKRTVESK